MKVKLVSPKAELTVIQSLCNRNLKISGTVLSMIDSSYFFEPLSKELYEYIKNAMAESPEPPKPRQLLADPELSSEAKEFFKSVKVPTNSVEEAIRNVNTLNKYRRTRIIYDLAKSIGDSFNNESRLNIDQLVTNCAEYIVNAQSSKSTTDAFLHLGSNDNAKDLLHDLIYSEDKADIIKTGFTTFDKISGGFDRGGLVTIGAPSGCGKSTVSTQLAINFAQQGYKVVLVPLEMSKKEMGNRILANIGNMELSKIRQHKLDEREKVLLAKRQKRWRKKVYNEGGRLTIFKPEADLDIDEVYAAVSGLKCDVVIVDYISLLKGIDDENQWLRLGTIARKAKINAEVTNRVNIMVCQVSDEGKIRYSGAIKEHSSTAFVWTPNEEEKKSGLIRVEQIKSRNSEPFPFTLQIVWNKMQVKSVEEDQVAIPDITDQDVPNLASDI